MKHCVVVGGGLAGLAAALRLSTSEYSVTLVERTPALGGRARSFIDRSSRCEIDNGQHVLMGCYRSTLQYLEEAGVKNPALRRMRGLALPFHHIDGRRSLLQAGRLPHPLSLVQAFLRYDMLPLRGRLHILRVALRLRSLKGEALKPLDRISAEVWLHSCGQGEAEIELFWRPVILATMNSEPVSVSAKLFVIVLREIFLGASDAADMLLPEIGLTALFIDPVRRELEVRGVRILTSSAVSAVQTVQNGDRQRVSGVRCEEVTIAADAVISTVPPWAFAKLGTSLAVDTDMFIPSEILSIHVWLRRDLGQSPMTGL
ncbi:MAG: FAD-dependent oxidoreductase, partial [Bacteroidota bacterium]